MADVFSLYPGPSKNALADPASAINIFSGITRLQGAQRELAGRVATGDAFQNALRPDGTVDQDALTAGLKSNPAAAYTLPETMDRVLAQRGQQISNVTNQFSQKVAQNGFLMDRLGSLADLPNPTKDDVRHFAVTASRNTDVPSTMLNALVDSLPSDGPGLKAALSNFRNQAVGSAGLSTRVSGPPTPSGAPTTISTGQANIAGPQGIPTANPPGSEQSAALMQSDAARAGNFGQEIFPWQQALEKIKALGPGGLGPGSKGRQDFESFLYAASPSVATMMGVNPQKIANYAEAEKYLTNATQQRANSFGAHTDMQLSTALTGSPNVHINDLAAEDVTKAAIALRRMEHAQYVHNAGPAVVDPATGKTKPGGAVNYAANKAAWAASQDARAYAIDMMSPEQIAKMDKSLKGVDRAKFNASLKAAIDSGVVAPPGRADATQ